MTSSSQIPAILYVDGYNIIGAWSILQKLRDHEGLEIARDKLIEILVNYSALKGFDTQLIFDAQYQLRRSNHQIISPNLAVVYTDAKETADTYIERSCAILYRSTISHQKKVTRVLVATDDRAQKLTVLGYGAEPISAQELGQEIGLTDWKLIQKREPKKRSPSRLLGSCLDPKAREQLAKLRLN